MAADENQFGDWFAVAGNHNGFALLDEFQKPRELSFGLVDVNLHSSMLGYLVS